MNVLSWLRLRICRLPLPAPHPLPEVKPMIRPEPDARLSAEAIEASMDEVFAANSRAAMSSLVMSQEAITAEERTRSILDDLMREMDRGRHSGNG